MDNGRIPDNLSDVGAPAAHIDPMLLYFREWWNLQALKGDPARRPNLARDAYLSGAAQGVLLARTTVATIQATSTSGWLQTVQPPAPTKLQWEDGEVVDAEFPGTPTIAECIAQLDVWNGHLEAAIDRQAHEKLGQHANDAPAAGDRDPMEQLP